MSAPSFLDRVLDRPSYGWANPDGSVVRPSAGVLIREALSRMNVFRSRKNWLAFSNWFWTLSLAPFLVTFALHYFSWPLVVAGFLYSMVGMGSYGTLWLHRYGTHGAYTIERPFFRFLVDAGGQAADQVLDRLADGHPGAGGPAFIFLDLL